MLKIRDMQAEVEEIEKTTDSHLNLLEVGVE